MVSSFASRGGQWTVVFTNLCLHLWAFGHLGTILGPCRGRWGHCNCLCDVAILGHPITVLVAFHKGDSISGRQLMENHQPQIRLSGGIYVGPPAHVFTCEVLPCHSAKLRLNRSVIRFPIDDESSLILLISIVPKPYSDHWHFPSPHQETPCLAKTGKRGSNVQQIGMWSLDVTHYIDRYCQSPWIFWILSGFELELHVSGFLNWKSQLYAY